MGRKRRLISICLTATAAAAASVLAPPRHHAFAQTQSQSAPEAQSPADSPPARPSDAAPAAQRAPAPVTNAGPATAPTSPTASPPAVPPAAPRGPDVAGDVRRLAEVLRNPAARPAERDEAASRLVSRHGAQADAVLREVLDSGSAAGRMSVARALADDPSPNEEFIGPLAGLLGGGEQRSAALAEAAANALAGYRHNAAALGHLIRSANDANQPAPLRVAAVRALGRVVDPAAAQALVPLATATANERKEVRDAAADALVEMTGLVENARDPRRWAQWWQQAGPGDNPDAWRADLLEARAARLDRVRRRHESLVADLKQRLSRQYQAAEKETRQKVLLDFLNSGEPEIRVIGTDFVTLAMQENEAISGPVRDRLVDMVGDGDPEVRLRTAETLYNMNYAGALGALLTQLAQERDDRVKVALAGAIAPIEDPAAVPALIDLLNNNTSPAVAIAAVRALGAAGRDLRATDPALANTVADRFRAIVRQRRNTAGAEELRVAALDGLASLKDPRVLDMGRGLLGEPSPAIRQATLRVIGELGNERGAEMVLDVLGAARRDPVIRRLALDALGKTGGMVYYQTLYDYTQPRNEPDPEVREAAWQALRAALPRGSAQQLSDTAQLFRGDPDHRVFVYQVLAERLRQQGKMADWAQQIQNLADEELSLKTPRRSEAAAHYEEALKYWIQNGGAPITIEELTTKVVQARLAAGQYAQAAAFAESAIARQKEAAQEVGRVIKNEADRLRNLATPADYRSAIALIDAALKMNPPLEQRHKKDLNDIRADIEAATGGGGNRPDAAQ